jgi:hypothetical protein
MDLEMPFDQYVDMTTISESIKYVVDIGAQDGPGPVFSLMTKHGYRGLCIEGNPITYTHLCDKMPEPHVAKHCEFVTPHNICSIFQKHNIPTELFALKIDIDGYDYEVLDTLLSSYKPLFVVAEINEKIPPPIYFQTLYNPTYVWGTNHFFGFSLQAAYKLMEKHGYTIIRIVGGNNIMCIRKDVAPHILQVDALEMYKRDYLHNLPVLWTFPWNRDIHHWTQLCDDATKIDETVNDIIDYFTSKRIQREENVGQPVSRDSFTIYVANS